MESKLRSPKRFEKTRSRMVHPCDQRGLGDASPTSRILDYGPRMPCLPFSSERFDDPFWSAQIKRQAMRGWPITAICAFVGEASPIPFDHMINHVAARFRSIFMK